MTSILGVNTLEKRKESFTQLSTKIRELHFLIIAHVYITKRHHFVIWRYCANDTRRYCDNTDISAIFEQYFSWNDRLAMYRRAIVPTVVTNRWAIVKLQANNRFLLAIYPLSQTIYIASAQQQFRFLDISFTSNELFMPPIVAFPSRLALSKVHLMREKSSLK